MAPPKTNYLQLTLSDPANPNTNRRSDIQSQQHGDAWSPALDDNLQALDAAIGNLQAGVGDVTSIFGRSGAVVAAAGDYNYGQISGTPGVQAQAGLNQITSGGNVDWTGNLNFTVGSAAYTISGQSYTSPATNITLASADLSLDRIDTIVVDNTGAVVVLQGTPAATPLQPSSDPSTQLELTFVYVAAGATTPANVSKTDIYHTNAEWTTSRSGTVFNLGSTNNPPGGADTEDVEATAATLNSWVQFVKPASGTVDLGTFNALVFYIRSKATWNAARSLSIQWRNGSTVKGAAILLRDGAFGFNSSITNAYQQISIPASLFGISGIAVTGLRVTVAGTGTTTIGFYLGDITLQGGITPTTLPTGIMLFRGAWSATAAYNVNDVVVSGNGVYIAIQGGTNHTPASSATFWMPIAQLASGFADAEVPSGTINGSNAAFTLAHAPSPAASLMLFKNGMLQKAGGVDYTLSNLTITYAVAPTSSPQDAHIASYRY